MWTRKRPPPDRTNRWPVILLLSLLLGGLTATPAFSHGNEVEIKTASFAPDASLPLTRLYRAVVTFLDGDPVEDAVMTLSAVRSEDGSSIVPVPFRRLDQPGRYIAEVDFTRFGNWEITVSVTEPGAGSAEFTDTVLPSGSVEDSGGAGGAETLSVLFRFDGGDWTNVVVRIVHSVAGATWVALIGLGLAGAVILSPDAGSGALQLLRRVFGPVASVSLLALLASGLHSATWGTPIAEPGVFDLDTLLEVPYGEQYALALAAMTLAWVGMVLITLRLRAGLRTWNPTDGAGLASIKSASLAGLAVTLLLVIDVTVLLYLHNISHLSLVVPR